VLAGASPTAGGSSTSSKTGGRDAPPIHPPSRARRLSRHHLGRWKRQQQPRRTRPAKPIAGPDRARSNPDGPDRIRRQQQRGARFAAATSPSNAGHHRNPPPRSQDAGSVVEDEAETPGGPRVHRGISPATFGSGGRRHRGEASGSGGGVEQA
jgi:hypothetical protein